jgi:thermitase
MHRILRVLALGAVVAGLTAAPAHADSERVIVKFQPGAASATQSAALGSASVLGFVRALQAKVVAPAGDPAALVARLNASPAVQYAEIDKTLHATAIPNDPRFTDLYGMNNTGQAAGTPDADINAPEGWDAAGLGAFPTTGGPKIGIVDTGIRATHEDLAGQVADCARSQGTLFGPGKIQEGSCADDNGHGTHVAGTIAGHANNGKGVAGVAFNSPLTICKALSGTRGSGSTSDVANCITWAADKGVKVLSMSLGGGTSTTLQNAVKYAAGKDVLIVAAAGNDGNATLNYPAAYPEVVSVAATDRNDQHASFSNANDDVEIAAPGVDVVSSYNSSDTSYTTLSGTSMATPHVAGVAAVIRGKNPTFTAEQARSKLDASVDDKGAAGRDPQYGFGRVNLQKAAT